ncbi:ACP S-malonyltransferase [Candidatus Protofrankia datiscae]|uniref:[acyl-carrier-protein] S-malonyltransferase n=2 Tax=Protofrankia TaxID=2994361 RepID=F8AXM0_9ACTN|nr:ACP S-malonyltransferase [Candidatus Protofrankia datiscae]AEH10371.1 malonyl CoA-acyl carrier protein transacylase [Candidatus Protofrankia datiscae]
MTRIPGTATVHRPDTKVSRAEVARAEALGAQVSQAPAFGAGQTAGGAAGERVPGTRCLAMFPGQGSQRPGMAADLVRRYPDTAGQIFAMADDVLGLPLTKLCVSGSAEELRRTDVTQPAIAATSLAVLEVLRAGGFEASGVAGHSLGEYAALAAAGVLDAQSVLRLVRRRGELMAEVGSRTPGAMAAVIGLPAERVEALCRDVTGTGVVEIANYNDPGQTVVSGLTEAVAHIETLAARAGAERIVRLDVGAPFHCSLMRDIEAEFGVELDRHVFAEPQLPVLSAVTSSYVRRAEEVRLLLRRQLVEPVRWVDTVRRAVADGHNLLVEVGPGRVLTGFAKRIVPDVRALGTARPQAIDALLATAGQGASRPAVPA